MSHSQTLESNLKRFMLEDPNLVRVGWGLGEPGVGG